MQSDVADARRRQSAVEAQANADIVVAEQQRRAKEAQLAAEQAISDKNRDLEQTRAQNAALIAQAEAKKQDALAFQRHAELQATEIAQAKADAERVRLGAQAAPTQRPRRSVPSLKRRAKLSGRSTRRSRKAVTPTSPSASSRCSRRSLPVIAEPLARPE